MRPARVMRLHKLWFEMFKNAAVNANGKVNVNKDRGNGKLAKETLLMETTDVLEVEKGTIKVDLVVLDELN